MATSKTNRLAAMKRATNKPNDTRGVGRAQMGRKIWPEGSPREESTESSDFEKREDSIGRS